MAIAPQTWTVLTSIQAIIQSEVRVASASPYSLFSAADAAKFGATNAIYIGAPKDMQPTTYPNQCWVIPPKPEKIYHRSGLGATGSIVWQEQSITILHLFDYQQNYWQALQTGCNATDALVPVLMRHVDSGFGATVAAARLEEGNATGYFFLDGASRSFFAWQCTLWIKQQWVISGGVVS